MANFNHVILAGTVRNLAFYATMFRSDFELEIWGQDKPAVWATCSWAGEISPDLEDRDFVVHGELVGDRTGSLSVRVINLEVI